MRERVELGLRESLLDVGESGWEEITRAILVPSSLSGCPLLPLLLNLGLANQLELGLAVPLLLGRRLGDGEAGELLGLLDLGLEAPQQFSCFSELFQHPHFKLLMTDNKCLDFNSLF